LLCGFAALTLPAYGQAAVTVGPDVNQTPTSGVGCSSPSGAITFSNQGASGISPLDGVVVRWRVHSFQGGTNPPITPTFRIVRASGASTFTGAGSSGPVAPFSGVAEFGAQVSIRTGDRIGLGMPCSSSSPQFVARVSSGSHDGWNPGLADGESPGRAPTVTFMATLLLNADIEADADHDGFGDETQDACPAKASTPGACVITAPSISGKTEGGKTLTVNAGPVQGGAPSYQWLRGSGNTFNPIPGATGTTYRLGRSDRGKLIKVTESVTNPKGSDSATSNPTVAVGPPIVSSSARKGQRAVRQHGVVVKVKSNLAGTLTATGTIALPRGIAKTLRFKRAIRSLAAGKSRKFTLRLSKKSVGMLKRALVRKRKLKAKLALTVKDKLGGRTSRRVTVTLRR
jgi:hypothetical protein